VLSTPTATSPMANAMEENNEPEIPETGEHGGNTRVKISSGLHSGSHKQNHVHFASSSTLHSFIPEQAKEKAIIASSYPIDKYMVYSDDQGNAMRLSKKLFELISCVKEEVVCAEQVQQMQYKIANYITTNDFSGLMEMLRNMKENK
jgi:hypothetical protein